MEMENVQKYLKHFIPLKVTHLNSDFSMLYLHLFLESLISILDDNF